MKDMELYVATNASVACRTSGWILITTKPKLKKIGFQPTACVGKPWNTREGGRLFESNEL